MNPSDYLRALIRAETLSDEGEWPAAATWWQRVVDANPVNGAHCERLAEARFRAGEYEAARAAYERAGELGVWSGDLRRLTFFAGEIDYRIACCHAELGDSERAADALKRALDAGLRDLDPVRADDRWTDLRDDERFSMLLNLDVGALPRDEGWRHDLRLFAIELKRRAYDPFRHISEADFDAALAELARQVPEFSDARIVVELMRLLRQLKDGHAWISAPDGHPLRPRLPVDFYLFAEGLHVTGVDPRFERLLGAKVVAVDGHPIDEVMAALDDIASGDNDHRTTSVTPDQLRHVPLLHALGLTAAPDAAELALEHRDGSVETVRLPAEMDAPNATAFPRPEGWTWLSRTLPNPEPHYLRHRDVDYWFEYLAAHRLVYLQFNSITSHPREDLPAFADRAFDFIDTHDVEALVIDLRWNAGGNTLLGEALLHRLLACRKVNRRGSLFVVIGRETFSAAQNTATFIERHGAAIFVGEPSGASPNFVGEVAPFTLPYNKLRVNVSDLYWQSSWPVDDRTWIPPEIYTPPTFADFVASRDPALEAVIACRDHLPGL